MRSLERAGPLSKYLGSSMRSIATWHSPVETGSVKAPERRGFEAGGGPPKRACR